MHTGIMPKKPMVKERCSSISSKVLVLMIKAGHCLLLTTTQVMLTRIQACSEMEWLMILTPLVPKETYRKFLETIQTIEEIKV